MEMNTERNVVGNVLTSTYLPPIRIQIDPAFHYIGKLQFILYAVAKVEVFAFVVADQQYATRVLLIDFEGYLENNTHTYNYPATATVDVSGQAFIADGSLLTRDMRAQLRPDSDAAQIITFIQQQGYTLPDAVMIQRFVRLVDAAKRNELLVFYLEDALSLGVSETECRANALEPTKNEGVLQNLRERAMASFVIANP